MNDKISVVKKYLDIYDYYALLEGGAPKDEFMLEAKIISSAISEESTIEEIAITIANVMHRTFGNEEKMEYYMEIANKIWEELHRVSPNK